MVFGGGGLGEVGSTNVSESTDFNLVNFDNGAGCVEEDEDDCRLEVDRVGVGCYLWSGGGLLVGLFSVPLAEGMRGEAEVDRSLCFLLSASPCEEEGVSGERPRPV